ncbi:MAG: Acyl-CoA dehydrogenase, partial [uncultured Solirubrobacteraceae bacterium]
GRAHVRAVQADRRSQPRAGVEAPLVRQGALPRQPPPGPDPPPAAHAARGPAPRRRVPPPPQGVPAGAGRPAADRGRRPHPRPRHPGPEGPRRPRHEDPRGVRRPRALAGLLQPRAGARGHVALRPGHAAVGPPVHRPARAAADVRHGRAEGPVAAEGRAHARVRVPAHGARRRLGSRAHDHRRGPDGGRDGLPHLRHEAVGDERRHRRRRDRHGRRPEGRGVQGRHHGLHLPVRRPGGPGRDPQRLHGPARHRELPHHVRGRLRPQGRRGRRDRQGPEDRAGHAEHRAPVAARDLRGHHEVLPEDRPRVGGRAQAVGPARRRARPRRPAPGVHRGDGVRAGGRRGRRLPPGRRQAQRLPHRGGDRQALRLRAGLAGRGHDDPGPRRPRLRDGRVAQGPRGEADPGRAAPARHAHQPDLRGLHGDHAPAHRPRG